MALFPAQLGVTGSAVQEVAQLRRTEGVGINFLFVFFPLHVVTFFRTTPECKESLVFWVMTPQTILRWDWNDFKILLQERGNKDVGFSHLCQRSPKEVAVCVVKLLKPLCNHMENMHNYFQVSGQQFWLKKSSSFVASKGMFGFTCGEKRSGFGVLQGFFKHWVYKSVFFCRYLSLDSYLMNNLFCIKRQLYQTKVW